MTKPQSQELQRAGLGNTDQDAKELRAQEAERPETGGETGPVPEANQPGHRPAHDQDKPEPGERP